MANLFLDLGLLIVIAAVFAIVAKFLRQPLIIGYMLAGIFIGPMGLGLVKDYATIAILSEIGIAFLLFVVGLELDVRKLKNPPEKTSPSIKGFNVY